MTSQPLAITGVGMMSAVGLSAPASCAAIRCGLNRFEETRFMDGSGVWLQGGDVPMTPPWHGFAKLVHMSANAIEECLQEDGQKNWPVLICLSEKNQAGRMTDLDQQIGSALEAALGRPLHEASAIFSSGRVSIVPALFEARRLLYEENHLGVVITGTDSMLNGPLLAKKEEQARVLTASHSDGFIPGEGAACIRVEKPGDQPGQLIVEGLGLGTECAPIGSGKPCRADGLTQAIQAALSEAGMEMGNMDFRITDLSGGQYFFRETSLAQTRTLRKRKEVFQLWHPAECTGEIGAAIGPAILVVAFKACKKGYAPGARILCHISNEDEQRGALILTWQKGGKHG